jgi:hypothetical protein
VARARSGCSAATTALTAAALPTPPARPAQVLFGLHRDQPADQQQTDLRPVAQRQEADAGRAQIDHPGGQPQPAAQPRPAAHQGRRGKRRQRQHGDRERRPAQREQRDPAADAQGGGDHRRPGPAGGQPRPFERHAGAGGDHQ